MTPYIKELETEAEVNKWLEKHGYGPGLIEEELAAWKASKVVAKPATTPKAIIKTEVNKPEVVATSTKK